MTAIRTFQLILRIFLLALGHTIGACTSYVALDLVLCGNRIRTMTFKPHWSACRILKRKYPIWLRGLHSRYEILAGVRRCKKSPNIGFSIFTVRTFYASSSVLQ